MNRFWMKIKFKYGFSYSKIKQVFFVKLNNLIFFNSMQVFYFVTKNKIKQKIQTEN